MFTFEQNLYESRDNCMQITRKISLEKSGFQTPSSTEDGFGVLQVYCLFKGEELMDFKEVLQKLQDQLPINVGNCDPYDRPLETFRQTKKVSNV